MLIKISCKLKVMLRRNNTNFDLSARAVDLRAHMPTRFPTINVQPFKTRAFRKGSHPTMMMMV